MTLHLPFAKIKWFTLMNVYVSMVRPSGNRILFANSYGGSSPMIGNQTSVQGVCCLPGGR